MDPLAEEYYSFSEFGYTLNNPMNAVDPNGGVVIFINGFYGIGTGACCGGSQEYWGSNWVSNILGHIGDYKARFYDGGIGGLTGLSYNLDPGFRKRMGYNEGKKQAKEIINSLARDGKDPNKIIESVKFITNSMGAAFQRGFSLALSEYVFQYNIDNPDSQLSGFEIEFTVDIAAFQGKDIGPDHFAANSYFMRSIDDIVAGFEGAKIDGATELGIESNGNSSVKMNRNPIPVTIVDEFGKRTIYVPANSNRPHHASFWDAIFFPTSSKNDPNVRRKRVDYEQKN